MVYFVAPVEEGQSDADSISVDYDSPESTEDSAVESSARSSPGADHHAYSDAPTTPKASKASQMAATRGLNIAVSNRGNRHSRIIGIPGSPLPTHSPKPQQTVHVSHHLPDSPQTPR
jgi:RalA-binding protein 1